MKNFKSLLGFFAVLMVVSTILSLAVGAVHNGRDQFQEGYDIADRMFKKWNAPYGASEDVNEQHFFRVTTDGVEYQVTFYYYASSNSTGYGYSERPSEEWLREIEERRQGNDPGKLTFYESSPIYSGTKEAWKTGMSVLPMLSPENQKKYGIVIVTDRSIETFDDAVRHAQNLLGDNPDSSVDAEAVRRFREVGLSPDTWEWEIQPPSKENKGHGYNIILREKDDASQDELNAVDERVSEPESEQAEAAQNDNGQGEPENVPSTAVEKTDVSDGNSKSAENVVKSETAEPRGSAPEEDVTPEKDSATDAVDKNEAKKENVDEKKETIPEQPKKGEGGNFVGRLMSKLFSVFRR